MEARLRQALSRAEEVGKLLTDPAVTRDPGQLKFMAPRFTAKTDDLAWMQVRTTRK